MTYYQNMRTGKIVNVKTTYCEPLKLFTARRKPRSAESIARGVETRKKNKTCNTEINK